MDKQLELNSQQALEGLEELVTFMSYRSDCSGLRIFSIETAEQAQMRELAEKHAKVASIERKQYLKNKPETISKELRFNDRHFQS